MRRRACMLLIFGAAGCVAATGWERSDARACAADSPPIVCVEAQPDQPLEIRIGDLPILPGECARAPEEARGGSLRVQLVDRHGAVERERIPVRADRITFVVVDDRGRLVVRDRHPCDRTLPPTVH